MPEHVNQADQERQPAQRRIAGQGPTRVSLGKPKRLLRAFVVQVDQGCTGGHGECSVLPDEAWELKPESGSVLRLTAEPQRDDETAVRDGWYLRTTQFAREDSLGRCERFGQATKTQLSRGGAVDVACAAITEAIAPTFRPSLKQEWNAFVIEHAQGALESELADRTKAAAMCRVTAAHVL
jgi:hypothetical protein